MANEKLLIVAALKKLHDEAFTPRVYERSVVGQAALLLEKADYVEVVHGRWEYVKKTKDAKSGYSCSVCCGPVWHAPDVPLAFRYCPNCGAKMDGDGNE